MDARDGRTLADGSGPAVEARLADLEAFHAALVAAVPAFVCRTDASHRLLSMNRYAPGFTPENTLGQYVLDFIPPKFRARATEVFNRVQATGEPGHYDTVGPASDGRGSALYTTYVTPVAQLDGRPGLCLVAVDVSYSRRREHTLRETTDQLELARQLSGLGLWSFDLVTGTMTWDQRMLEIMGTTAPVDPAGYSALVHPDDRPMVDKAMQQAFAERRWRSVPHRIVRPSDGAVRWISSTGAFVDSPDGGPSSVVGGSLDVTEQRLLDEHALHRQKLEAIGGLAAGIAHNFNNMLAVIVPVLEMVRPELTPRSTAILDDARHAAQRAAEMIRQLMTFAGQGRLWERRPTAIDAVITRALALCRHSFEQHISLEVDLAPDLALVSASAGELEQVLVNLLFNARDAVLASAKPTPHVHVSAGLASPIDPSRPGEPPLIRIQIRDDGIGMTPDVMAHAFEPFFTTKDVGAGTGLGLAISYAIARDHGGRLEVESRAGEGATFSLYLPIAGS